MLINTLYPEITEGTVEAVFEAWLDMARQGILAAWMHCFEKRCYFYRLGEIHEYSDCLKPTDPQPELRFLEAAKAALIQALILVPFQPAAQFSLKLVQMLLSPSPSERQNLIQQLASLPAPGIESVRKQRFLQKCIALNASLGQVSAIGALSEAQLLREQLGFDLPLPTFPLETLSPCLLSAEALAQAFAARLKWLLGTDLDLTAQMSWRTGLTRILMESEQKRVTGQWQIVCLGPEGDPFLKQAESWGEVRRALGIKNHSADLITLWHLESLDANAEQQLKSAWQVLKSEGLLLAAFSRSRNSPEQLRMQLEELVNTSVDLIDRESFSDRLVAVIWKKPQPAIELRVLILMRPDSALSFGGADLQMFRSRARLRALGIQTDVSLACRLDFEYYDLIYVVGYLHEQYQFRLLQATSKPIVGMPISTLFYRESALAEEIYQYLNQQITSGLNLLKTPPPHLLQWLKNWNIEPLWKKVCSDWQKTGMKAKIDKISGQFASVCDFLVPQAQTELDYLQSHNPQPLPPYRLLPNGCDPELYKYADPNLFEQTYGLRDFLLCVGRIEPNKNQLLLCYALRESEIPIVLVGKESRDLFDNYLDLCQLFGNGRILVLQDLSDAMLASAYAAARLFVLPSASESFPLSTLEAVWAGCPVVLSQNSVQGEFFRDLFYLVDPLNPEALRTVIETAWQADNRPRIRAAQARVQAFCSWEQMAKDLKWVFQSVQKLALRQKGQTLVWREDHWVEIIQSLIPPVKNGPFEQEYHVQDLSQLWSLSPEESTPWKEETFVVGTDLAHYHLKKRGFKRVKTISRFQERAQARPLQADRLLCLYHPQAEFGHREIIQAYLQAFSATQCGSLTLYLPDTGTDIENVEAELLAQIEDLGLDLELIPELAVIATLSEAEEKNLLASATGLLFPLKRLWGNEQLLAKLWNAGAPLLTHGWMADWQSGHEAVWIIMSYTQLCALDPLERVPIDSQSLIALFKSL